MTDYPYVLAWYSEMQDPAPLTAAQMVEEARTDGAPADAFQRRTDGTWATLENSSAFCAGMAHASLRKHRGRAEREAAAGSQVVLF